MHPMWMIRLLILFSLIRLESHS